MSQCIENSLAFLEILASASPKLTKSILKESNSDLICSLVEIFKNVEDGAIILSATARHFCQKVPNARKLSRCAKKYKSWKVMQKNILVNGIPLISYILPSVLDQIKNEKTTGSSSNSVYEKPK